MIRRADSGWNSLKGLCLALLFCAAAAGSGQTIYPPINAPVFRAFDANGAPLAGGQLFTYAAGSSTPLATYADAGGMTPNTNPVVLDSTGQAKIFLGAATYKFVLEDANGVTLWTVDNIAGAQAASLVTSVFGRTGVVVAVSGDYSCGQITGAVCSLPTLYYQTVQNNAVAAPQEPTLNFVPAGGISTFTITAGGSGYTAAPTVTFSGGGCATEPTGTVTLATGAVTNPVITGFGAGCTSAPTPVFSGGSGSGATGATTLATAGVVCTDDTANTSTDCTVVSAPAVLPPIPGSFSDVTDLRVLTTVYQNTSGTLMYVSGYAIVSSGSSTSNATCNVGPTSTPAYDPWSNDSNATVSSGHTGFACLVESGWYYSVTGTGLGSIGRWTETLFK